ncbi:MAG: hypothetical protein J6F30_13350 [Cellulosilyticum sp.]|nr:hypothetical protein [Cellulosilyticum sp.]
MKMSKNYKRLCLALGLTGILGAGTVSAVQGTKNLQATYRNIQVTYNGQSKPISNEPFLVDGSTYVPLRAVGEILGVNATWNPATNTVALSGGSTTSSDASEAQIAQLNYQIAQLTKQLSDANAELANYKANSSTNNGSSSSNTSTSGSSISTAQLQETENYLNDNFSDELNSNISLSFDLSLAGNQIDVTISYDSKAENNTYNNKLTASTVEKFLKRIGDNIAATHADIAIAGTIEYTGGSEEKVSFERTKAGKYTYTHAFDEETLEELIDDEMDGYFYFEGITPSSLTLSEYNVTIREAKSTVTVKLYLSSNSTFTALWGTEQDDKNKDTIISASKRKSAVTEQLENLYDVLTAATNGYEVSIDVYYNDKADCIASIDENGKISTESFTYKA